LTSSNILTYQLVKDYDATRCHAFFSRKLRADAVICGRSMPEAPHVDVSD
jgi:hypothetical protein